MRYVLLLLTMLTISCQKKDKPFECNADPVAGKNLSVGISIDSTPELQELFSSVEPSRFTSGSFCQDTYDFNQFNEDTFDWCYYYQVDVECSSGVVDSIYDGA